MAGFWIGVMEYKDSLGHHHFRDLATYAITFLVILIRNAVVERMFSQDTLAKSSLRSRMSLGMLEALIRILSWLFFDGKCCIETKVTVDMLAQFNDSIYQGNDTTEEDEDMQALENMPLISEH